MADLPQGRLLRDLRPDVVLRRTVQWAYHLVLPWLVFGLLNAALYTMMIRASVLEAMNEDYVRTARAKARATCASCESTWLATCCCRS